MDDDWVEAAYVEFADEGPEPHRRAFLEGHPGVDPADVRIDQLYGRPDPDGPRRCCALRFWIRRVPDDGASDAGAR